MVIDCAIEIVLITLHYITLHYRQNITMMLKGLWTVMRSETVGLRTGSVLVLVLRVWCCVVLGTSLLRRSTVAFTYLKVKSTKCFCLLPVVVLVLVLLFWSWS